MQRFGDAENGLIDACLAFFAGHVPQGDDLSGRMIFLIIEYGPVDNDIQQLAALGQTFGLKAVKNFLFKQPLDAGTGFRFRIFGDKGDDFTFDLFQRPAENLLKSGIQIKHRIVHIEHKHGIR